MTNKKCPSLPSISLREYIETRFLELEKRIDQRTELLVVANERDKVTMNERLSGMNEFRASLRDQASSFVDRKEFDLRLKPVEAFVNEIRGRIAVAIWGIGIFFVVIQVILRIIWAR